MINLLVSAFNKMIHNYFSVVKNILTHPKFLFLLGALIVLLLPAFEHWGLYFYDVNDPARINTVIANGIAYFFIYLILNQFQRFAGTSILSFIIPSVSIVYFLILSFFILSRFNYARHVIITGFSINIFYFIIQYFLIQKNHPTTYALVPFGKISEITKNYNIKKINFIQLDSPSIENLKVKGIVADLHYRKLEPKWTQFLAECTLKMIPVFHVQYIQESLTGYVQIEHLSENQFGSLLPSPFYMIIKRLIDLCIVLITLPVTVLLMGVISIFIKMESNGNILFKQERKGQGNSTFTIYKFRSMYAQPSTGNKEITKVGKIIRKFRLDELPQIFNIIKGDMSLIGPRPLEPNDFVEKFKDEIPFYIYRHIVKPGMTGWAQVMQGHTSHENDTIIKIQYDFYYIKNFSFWLDILILFKTIRVVLTGFGAK
ncbi:sugar transferase [Acinetobacter chinensis]|uniref:sugar transferase n=1 Tax=Acinetobacter chinensis TaxID=2004650 RepID=UPI002934EFE9|nr:sugar transferase [Acinetobacter chinensis]WOE41340.1 sugar transferase [Acinetobacter chinensis]